MTAPAKLEELQSLLRKQGLGSVLPKPTVEGEPPLSTGLPDLDKLLGGGLPGWTPVFNRRMVFPHTRGVH